MINAYAALEPRGEPKPFAYEAGPLGAHEVEIEVAHCGICHSVLSMLNDKCGQSQYPLVPGAVDKQRLSSAVTFIGTGGPRLMLTQEPEYDRPYYALLLVNTTAARHPEAYAQAVRERVAEFIEARITVDQFMLGPPVKDPIALRLSGPDRDVIARKAREMVRLFNLESAVGRGAECVIVVAW